MESPDQDLARAKEYLSYVIKVHGGHDFDPFFGECQCGVVMQYWKSAMHYRLDQLYVHGNLLAYHSEICEYSEV